jgi:hypothetical protein
MACTWICILSLEVGEAASAILLDDEVQEIPAYVVQPEIDVNLPGGLQR